MASTAARQPVVSAYEASALLNCSLVHIYNSIERGDIFATQLGKRWTIPVAEIERIIGHQLPQETIDWGKQAARIRYRVGFTVKS